METKTKHTPGPLVADCYGAHTVDNYIEITVRAGDESPDCACQLRYSHLIAAAPELLEACQAVAALANEQGRMNLPMVAGMARIAIAKAEGKQQS